MLFPELHRVLYERNPLEEVICQLRFPAILRITAEPPARFQDAIRHQFPVFKERRDTPFTGLPEELRAALPAEMLGLMPDVAFDFESEDGGLTVSLTKDFLALTARHYGRWEEFREILLGVWDACRNNYQPAYITRVGLRYRNILRRSKLGLGNTAWSHLLKPHILGVLQEGSVAEKVVSSIQDVRLSDGEEKQVRIRHGLSKAKDADEVCYLIDSDFFAERKVPCDRAQDTLDGFHVDANRLFQWCIERGLHDALGPQVLD